MMGGRAREHEMNAITRIATAAVMLGSLLGAMPLAAAPIETGRQIADVNGTPMVVFTYRPAGCSDPSLLMVFHGIARNARTYRDDARALADRLCLLVVAPLFDRQAFPGWRYQRGGIVKGAAVQNARDFTGKLVLDLVDWVRRQEGRPIAYSLFGHSAGGQFVDRLAAFVPSEARRIVVANAGSYVFPSLEIDAPFGLGKVYSAAEGEAALRRYLEQPLTIYLGQGDTRDDERNDYPEALAQGASRYQRGVNVFNAAKSLAQDRGWRFNWRLVELPGVGHDARKMLAAPQASEALSP
jgi:pimeloyl-ACP methyl ester carboxylesterase